MFNSAWRVQSGLHTVSQTLVGGLIGFTVGQASIILEKYIIYQKATDLPHVSYHILKEYTKGEVPLLLRVSVFMIGAFVLYKRELFDIEKRLYKNDKRIHVS